MSVTAELGWYSRIAGTKAYDLGQFAIELGVTAIGRSNFLSVGHELQRTLRDQLDELVMIAVWGSHGPVITSVEESSKPVVVTMRVGATLPLFRTATGWIFGAFMPRTVVKPIMRTEIAAGRGPVERLGKGGIESDWQKFVPRASRFIAVTCCLGLPRLQHHYGICVVHWLRQCQSLAAASNSMLLQKVLQLKY